MVRVAARSASVVPDSDRIVATVAGRGIPVSVVDERLAELRRGPRARHMPPDGLGASGDLRRWIVQELVTEAVLEHEARAAGIANEPMSGGALAAAAARLAAAISADVVVPEAEVRAYYDRNRDLSARPESRSVRQAVHADRRVAEAMMRDGDVAGEPVEIRRGELAGSLEDAIFGADVGDVVGPIRTEHGWHVARIEAVTTAFTVAYSDARTAIEAELLVVARTRAFDEWLDERRHALVEIEPEFEHPGHPRHGVPSHRH